MFSTGVQSYRRSDAGCGCMENALKGLLFKQSRCRPIVGGLRPKVL
jgi:hypothetical protein